MNRIINRFLNVFYGFLAKWKDDIIGFKDIKSIPQNKQPNLIVSLTSYGKRVSSTLPYTLASIFRQSKKPDKIVLNLDKDNWNIDNLPKKIKFFLSKGLEINFCDDIKSYKKLIPTLSKYPDACIVTVDDDYIYRKDLIEELWMEHLKYPSFIITTGARYPRLTDGNVLDNYDNWGFSPSNSNLILPIGAFGILYPPNSLFFDVTNAELFMKLSPKADDLWFWIMGILNNSSYIVASQNLDPGYSFDYLFQKLKIHNSLMHFNKNKKENDQQIMNIVNHYHLNFEKFRCKNLI